MLVKGDPGRKYEIVNMTNFLEKTRRHSLDTIKLKDLTGESEIGITSSKLTFIVEQIGLAEFPFKRDRSDQPCAPQMWLSHSNLGPGDNDGPAHHHRTKHHDTQTIVPTTKLAVYHKTQLKWSKCRWIFLHD